jgi:hypothetical protein
MTAAMSKTRIGASLMCALQLDWTYASEEGEAAERAGPRGVVEPVEGARLTVFAHLSQRQPIR